MTHQPMHTEAKGMKIEDHSSNPLGQYKRQYLEYKSMDPQSSEVPYDCDAIACISRIHRLQNSDIIPDNRNFKIPLHLVRSGRSLMAFGHPVDVSGERSMANQEDSLPGVISVLDPVPASKFSFFFFLGFAIRVAAATRFL